LQIPKLKRLLTPFVNGKTPDTEALGGIQKENFSKRSCGIMKTHR
jgi:hypothetical protein